MSDGLSVKADWVTRVLGVTFGGPHAEAPWDGPVDWPSARLAWQEANEAVDGQINGLRSALLEAGKSGDVEKLLYADALADIAETGLNAITENHRVTLMAAVMELGSGSPAMLAASGARALAQIQTFQAFIAGSEKIEVCDANPFGAPVAIRATLIPALRQMAAAIQAASA